jgi:hypothetical protein
VHALPAQVGGLVEPAGLVRATRQLDRDDDLEDRSLRRRPAEGQLEAGALVQLEPIEAPDADGDP